MGVWAALALSVLAAALSLLLLPYWVMQDALAHRPAQAVGHVVGHIRRGSFRKARYYPVVAFADATGTAHTFYCKERDRAVLHEWPQGTPVHVAYDPQHPEDALAVEITRHSVETGGLGYVLLVVAAAAALAARAKLRVARSWST